MVGWHHELNGHDFGLILGDIEYREGSHAAVLEMKESDITEELNNNSNLL